MVISSLFVTMFIYDNVYVFRSDDLTKYEIARSTLSWEKRIYILDFEEIWT